MEFLSTQGKSVFLAMKFRENACLCENSGKNLQIIWSELCMSNLVVCYKPLHQ